MAMRANFIRRYGVEWRRSSFWMRSTSNTLAEAVASCEKRKIVNEKISSRVTSKSLFCVRQKRSAVHIRCHNLVCKEHSEYGKHELITNAIRIANGRWYHQNNEMKLTANRFDGFIVDGDENEMNMDDTEWRLDGKIKEIRWKEKPIISFLMCLIPVSIDSGRCQSKVHKNDINSTGINQCSGDLFFESKDE